MSVSQSMTFKKVLGTYNHNFIVKIFNLSKMIRLQNFEDWCFKGKRGRRQISTSLNVIGQKTTTK